MGLSTLAAKADAAKVRSVVNERKRFETMAKEGEQRDKRQKRQEFWSFVIPLQRCFIHVGTFTTVNRMRIAHGRLGTPSTMS